jgi:cobalamin biosynthesis Mg chelatase CobN
VGETGAVGRISSGNSDASIHWVTQIVVHEGLIREMRLSLFSRRAMTSRMRVVRTVLAVLLVVSAAAFAIGVIFERSNGSETDQHESSTPTVVSGEQAETSEQHTEGEGEEGSESSESGESAEQLAAETEAAGDVHNESSEKLFGVNPEATWLVILAVALTVLLALAIWKTTSTAVLVAVVVFGIIFAAFDVREAIHQSDESNSGLVVVAVIVAILHLGVAVLAGYLIARRADDRLAAQAIT